MTCMLSCHWSPSVYLQTCVSADLILWFCHSFGSTAVVVEYSYPMWERLNVSTAKVTDRGTMCFGSRGSITSGGAGEPFSPGRAPQPPPQMFMRGGGGLGGLLGFGWVGASKPQNPPAPYKRSLVGRHASIFDIFDTYATHYFSMRTDLQMHGHANVCYYPGHLPRRPFGETFGPSLADC